MEAPRRCSLTGKESSARRRLESIARHLLPPEILVRDLYPNPLSAEELSSWDPAPVIIGGMVLDIHAKPSAHPVPGTTTPGKVQYVSGGVARNVAECMSKLGNKPFMISVVGHDMAGDLLLKYWKSAGLPTKGILKLEGIITPVVSNIFDSSGELAMAVASVEAVETFLTPGWIQQFWHIICSAPLLMVDANLNSRSLEVACQTAAGSGIPVWFEPVSVTKSRRIASVVNYITCASPNENELVAMANALSPGKEYSYIQHEALKGKRHSVESLFEMLKPAMCLLLQKGIKLLVVTLGSDGLFLCCGEGLSFMKDDLRSSRVGSFGRQLYDLVNESCSSKKHINFIKSGERSSKFFAFHYPALPASVVSLTGAGDCLVGGILASICNGLDVMQSVAVGIAVAKAAVETQTNVPAKFSPRTVADAAKQILSAAKVFQLE
ncbi:putative sugar kinase YeiI [Cocos nucifera]|uniref:Putative sugar kinase YeiI n=1 Tax=Cocos nucifera TaxID=13894 RepID=A0A8K0ITS3_COCNU|nr:putative sugar kinase YeiI [Cocos nucifera]